MGVQISVPGIRKKKCVCVSFMIGDVIVYVTSSTWNLSIRLINTALLTGSVRWSERDTELLIKNEWFVVSVCLPKHNHPLSP